MKQSGAPSRRIRVLQATAFVLLPVAAYVLLWRWLGTDALNRVAYLLWLLHGPDSDAITTHAGWAEAYFTIFMPVIVAGTAIGWRRTLARRRRHSGATDPASRMRRM